MIVVILALGTTDLIFALDSIPAIFGLTREPFIVFTANVFALMGLRQLYFLLGGLLKRLVYLSLGLAVILAFIGVKLILEAVHENQLPFVSERRADRGGPADPDLAVAHDHPGRPGHRHGGQPAEDPRRAGRVDEPVVDEETAKKVPPPGGPEAAAPSRGQARGRVGRGARRR